MVHDGESRDTRINLLVLEVCQPAESHKKPCNESSGKDQIGVAGVSKAVFSVEDTVELGLGERTTGEKGRWLPERNGEHNSLAAGGSGLLDEVVRWE